MKPVTMFQANDLSIWPTESEARQRDDLIAHCDSILRGLGMHARPDDCDYASGRGYVQQPAGTRTRLFQELRALGANRDSGGPIGELLSRHCDMDSEDREWGQPYFALHPEKGTAIALNQETEP